MNPLNSVKGVITGGIILAVVIALVIALLGPTGPEFNAQKAQSLIIWIHVLAGITWIGLLYYFNFVQVPALAEAAKDTGGPGGAGITKYVAPRALWWFRWGAVVTWLSGATYLGHLRILDDAFMLGFNTDPWPNGATLCSRRCGRIRSVEMPAASEPARSSARRRSCSTPVSAAGSWPSSRASRCRGSAEAPRWAHPRASGSRSPTESVR